MNLLIITQTVDENDQLLGFFISWLRFFSEKFKKITVLCLNEGQYSLPNNVKVICLGKSEGKTKLVQLFNFYQYIISSKDEYDSVFVHMNPIWVVLGGVSWRLMGKKIFLWYTHKSVTSKLKIAEKLSDVIFTASKESFRLSSSKVVVTGHGIDTELFKPNQEQKNNNQELKLLSVGRIAPIKNYGTLIEAAGIINDINKNFSVTMIGEAPLEKDKKYEKNLKFKIKDLELDKHFNFIGKLNHFELPKQYQTHDIFIHLSKTGSLDKTILEAMACGMKVLSSNDSSRSFLPSNLIFDENNPSELAEKIISVSKSFVDPALREYVIANHNLENLIEKISSNIQS